MPTIELTQTPKYGDLAVLKDNFEYGFTNSVLFIKFSRHDEEIAANNNKEYYVLTNRPPKEIIEENDYLG